MIRRNIENRNTSDLTELEMELVTLPEPGYEYESEYCDGVLIEEVVDWNEHEDLVYEVTEQEALSEQEDEAQPEENEEQHEEAHQTIEGEQENDETESEEEYEEQIETNETAPNALANKKRKQEDGESSARCRKRKRPLGFRYQLFDKLSATIVDYNYDNQPIVQFSATTSREREQLPVECGLCYAITSPAQALPHRQTHLQSNTDQYQCNYCDKLHEKYERLASHVRRHMSIQPYVCDSCTLYFCTKSEWYVHIRRRHQRFPCLFCAQMFKNGDELLIHVQNVHKGQRQEQLKRCKEQMMP